MVNARELLIELFEGMGLDGMSFDSDGVAGILLGDLAVNIHFDQTSGAITLFVRIGDIPEEPGAKLAAYAYLLKNNNSAHNGGDVLGIDEAERHAYFSHRFLVEPLTTARLERIVQAFLNLSDSHIAGFRNTCAQFGVEKTTAPENGIRA